MAPRGLLLGGALPGDARLVRVFRGRPNPNRQPVPAAANDAQTAAWERDPRVTVQRRDLNYRGWPQLPPQEKGVDVALAVDLIETVDRLLARSPPAVVSRRPGSVPTPLPALLPLPGRRRLRRRPRPHRLPPRHLTPAHTPPSRDPPVERERGPVKLFDGAGRDHHRSRQCLRRLTRRIQRFSARTA